MDAKLRARSFSSSCVRSALRVLLSPSITLSTALCPYLEQIRTNTFNLPYLREGHEGSSSWTGARVAPADWSEEWPLLAFSISEDFFSKNRVCPGTKTWRQQNAFGHWRIRTLTCRADRHCASTTPNALNVGEEHFGGNPMLHSAHYFFLSFFYFLLFTIYFLRLPDVDPLSHA